MVHMLSVPRAVETKVLDAKEGIVQALVNTTGVVDADRDVVVPGAHEMGLARVVPKGVWSHDWTTPIARMLDGHEIFPGDTALPGDLLAAGVGALQITSQFNMGTKAGQEAFASVDFFGPAQEWSVGYGIRLAKMGSEVSLSSMVHEKGREWFGEKGVLLAAENPDAQFILDWDVLEFSPVLWGASPGTRLQSVKSKHPVTEGKRLDTIERTLERIVVHLGSTKTHDDPGNDVADDITDDAITDDATKDTAPNALAISETLTEIETNVAWLYGDGMTKAALDTDARERVQNIVTALAALAAHEDEDDEDEDDAAADAEAGDGDGEGSGTIEETGTEEAPEPGDDDATTDEDEDDDGLAESDLMEFELLRAQVE